MHGINQNLTFTPVNIAVMTVSDTRTPETDTSGDILAERLTTASYYNDAVLEAWIIRSWQFILHYYIFVYDISLNEAGKRALFTSIRNP